MKLKQVKTELTPILLSELVEFYKVASLPIEEVIGSRILSYEDSNIQNVMDLIAIEDIDRAIKTIEDYNISRFSEESSYMLVPFKRFKESEKEALRKYNAIYREETKEFLDKLTSFCSSYIDDFCLGWVEDEISFARYGYQIRECLSLVTISGLYINDLGIKPTNVKELINRSSEDTLDYLCPEGLSYLITYHPPAKSLEEAAAQHWQNNLEKTQPIFCGNNLWLILGKEWEILDEYYARFYELPKKAKLYQEVADGCLSIETHAWFKTAKRFLELEQMKSIFSKCFNYDPCVIERMIKLFLSKDETIRKEDWYVLTETLDELLSDKITYEEYLEESPDNKSLQKTINNLNKQIDFVEAQLEKEDLGWEQYDIINRYSDYDDDSLDLPF